MPNSSLPLLTPVMSPPASPTLLPHQSTGFCHDGDCQRFPVVLGEIGSFLRSPMDLQQLQDMAAYARQQAPTDQQQYAHSPVSGWFW